MAETSARTIIALVVLALAAIGIAGTAGAASLITGRDIKNGSIGSKDLSKAAKRALKGQTGPQGPAGPQGATGAQGPAGPASLSTRVLVDEFFAPANDFAEGEVRCPGGMVAIGGSVAPGALFPVVDLPSPDGRGWVGSAIEVDGATDSSMLVSVICVPGRVAAVSVLFSNRPGERDVDELKAAARAAVD